MPRPIRFPISRLFGKKSWAQIIQKLKGRHPVLIIIVQRSNGHVSDIILKDSEDIKLMEDPELLKIWNPVIPRPYLDPELKKKIDAAFDSVDVDGNRIPEKKEGPSETPAPQENTHQPEEALPPLPENDAPVVEEELESDAPIGKNEQPENPKTEESDQEVDLRPGMNIVYSEDNKQTIAKVVEINEELQKLVIELSDKKQKIIKADQILSLA